MALNLPDRDVLETVIIPFFSQGTICFAGLDKNTKNYPSLFKTQVYFLDIDQRYLPAGSTVGDIRDLHDLFPEPFDAVIANGLAAFGLNTAESVQDTFDSVYKALKPHGIFVWGYSDSNERRIIDPVFIKKEFRPYVFPPLNTWRYPGFRSWNSHKEYSWDINKIAYQCHTFEFYQK